MATLTQTIVGIKKIAIFTALFILGVIAVWILFNFSKSLWQKIFPPKPVGVAAFGQLPSLELEKNPKIASSSGILFQLETANYKLPPLPEYLKVFPIIEPKINLWSQDNAKKKAANLGFSGEPEKLNEFTSKWTSDSPILRTFIYNIKEISFTYRSNFLADSEITSKRKVIEDSKAIEKAKKLLDLLGGNKKELTKTKVTRLSIKDGQLKDEISKADTDLFRVNFQRGSLEKIPVISSDPLKGEVSVLVSSLENNIIKEAVEADFAFWDLDLTGGSLYPVKTAVAAFEELKSGNGKIISNPKNDQKVTIRNVYLAYFNPPNLQKYFQPVIVFDGDNDFRAVVEAVNQAQKK